jgi:hypothetical protein
MPRIRRRNPENLPPRVYRKHNAYYLYAESGKWIRLGAAWDLEARTRWAELAGEEAPAGTVAELLRIRARVVPPKRTAPKSTTLQSSSGSGLCSAVCS